MKFTYNSSDIYMIEILLNASIGLPILLSLGALQGIIMSFVLGFSKKYKLHFVQFFALLLLTISIINIFGAFDIAKTASGPIFEDYVPYFWSNLIPPSVYFFVRFLTIPNYKFKKLDYLFFLPLLLDFLYQSFHFINFLINGEYSILAYKQFDFVGNVFELVASIFALAVFVISLRRVNQFNKQLRDQYSDIEKTNLYWAKRFLILGLMICIGWVLVSFMNVFYGYFMKSLAISIWISVTLLIYWTSYSMLKKKQLFEKMKAESSIELNASKLSSLKMQLSSQEIEQIQSNLAALQGMKSFHLRNDLSLRDLAKLLNSTDKKISAFLKQSLQTSFYDYINKLRIEEFKNRVNEDALDHFSITGIALQCGFKSKSSFYRAFKKYESTTPSQYLKQIGK